MTANSQLIQEIQKLIAELQTELTKMEASSQAFKDTTTAINAYTSALAGLTGQAVLARDELARLEQQMSKIVQARLGQAPLQEKYTVGDIRTRQIGNRPATTPVAAAVDPMDQFVTNVNEDELNKAFATNAKKRTDAQKAEVDAQAKANADMARQIAEREALAKRIEASGRDPAKYVKNIRAVQSANQQLDAVEYNELELQKERASTEETLNKNMAKQIQERTRLLQEAAQEQARVQRNMNIGNALPGGQLAAQNLYRQAGRVDPNFTPSTLRSVSEQGGVSRAQFQYVTDEGVIKSATFSIDRYGKVLADTQKRFRDFGSAIVRDTAEVLKWSIAVAAIYTPIQKLGELLTDMVQNETALANITVTLGNVQKSTSDIFTAAYQISQKVGEETNKVLEAYNAAYRAASGLGNAQDKALGSTSRFAAANKVLSDAITLAKLANIGEADAIDTLTAALRQTAQPGESLKQTMERSTELLDKWVAVTRVANVDINTLATGFSILGDAAEASGLDLDTLNGVIATLSESLPYSATELANTARAIVAGFQTDAAVTALGNLGIATKNSKGEAINFLEIVKQINQEVTSGAISKEQFGQLTLAIGGGTRRQAAVSTFIENQSRIAEVADISRSAKGSGEAADALAKKLDTVQTSVTQLGNAFQNLAQTLGGKGGILDVAQLFVQTVTALVGGFNDLIGVAGKAGPVLIASLAAFAYLKNQGPDFGNQMRKNVYTGASGLWSGIAGANQGGLLTSLAFGAPGSETATNRSLGFGRFARGVAPYAPAALAGAIPAIENLSQGKTWQAAGNAFGAIAGGALGNTLGGPLGAMIGSSLGSAIVEGIVTAAVDRKVEFKSLLAPIYEPATAQTQQQQAASEAQTFMQNQTGGTILTNLRQSAKQAIFNAAGKLFGGPGFQELNTDQIALIDWNQMYTAGYISKDVYEQGLEKIRAATKPETIAAQAQQNVLQAYPKETRNAQGLIGNELRTGLVNGTVSIAQYNAGRQALGNVGAAGANWFGAFGGNQNPQDFFTKAARISTFLKPEDTAQLTQYVQNISEATASMGDLTKGTDAYNQASAERNNLITAANDLMDQLNQKVLAQATMLKQIDFTGLVYASNNQPINPEDLAQQARARKQTELAANVTAGNMSAEESAAVYKASLQDILIELNGKFQELKNVPVDELNTVLENLKSQKEIIDAKSQGIGFTTYKDFTAQQFAGIVNGPQYNATAKQLEALGYKLDEQTDIAVTNEGTMTAYTKDWKIVQYLLSSILDVNQKQLDGMYNLPEGASFWIPAQAANLYPKQPALPTPGGNVTAPSATTTSPFEEWAKKNTLTLPNYGPQEPPDWMKKGFNPFATPYGPPLPTTHAGAGEPKDLGLYGPVAGPFGEYQQKPKPTNTILDFFKSLFPGIGSNPGGSVGINNVAKPDISGLFDLSGLTQAISNMSTKLSLNISNNTTVQLDGRQIAAVVKNYLKEDLLRYTGGTASKSVNVV